ncbi:hypothetical protein K0M31_013814, partial [Melipona bicolor]
HTARAPLYKHPRYTQTDWSQGWAQGLKRVGTPIIPWESSNPTVTVPPGGLLAAWPKA